MYNFYNPSIEGNLPVRVLKNNFMKRFMEVTPDFIKDFRHEVAANGLYEEIVWVWDNKPIFDIAKITEEREINIYASYCQMLWGICYTSLVLYYEHLLKIIDGKVSSNELDPKNRHIVNALHVFVKSVGLLKAFEIDSFFSLPNPERYSKNNKKYVEYANGVFETAMSFYLLHEFCHQYYDHISEVKKNRYVSNDERNKASKLYENDADEFAFEKMSNNFNSPLKDNFRLGIICSITSLIFMDKTLDGGSQHPDPDERMENILQKVIPNEKDTVWGVPAMMIELWAVHYKIELKNPLGELENPKDWFDIRLRELRDYKAGI